uniref:Large ribosomal subunit protein mL42 n=1 Tax=Globodera pallida TaxID=36090 RepID=A0A183BM95_GLOPA
MFTIIRRHLWTKLDKCEWQTVICSNGVIASWHPPKQFPYEHSRPFNIEKALMEKENFLNRKGDETFGTNGPDDLALREIFHTEMQEWRPIYREKRLYRAKVDDELKPILSNPPKLPELEGRASDEKDDKLPK